LENLLRNFPETLFVVKLPQAALMQLIPLLGQKLEDNSKGVRRAAVDIVSQLPQEAQVQLIPQLATRLGDDDTDVRRGAVNIYMEIILRFDTFTIVRAKARVRIFRTRSKAGASKGRTMHSVTHIYVYAQTT
jgi:hypothetical protein